MINKDPYSNENYKDSKMISSLKRELALAHNRVSELELELANELKREHQRDQEKLDRDRDLYRDLYRDR